jgi:hypothetical protein
VTHLRAPLAYHSSEKTELGIDQLRQTRPEVLEQRVGRRGELAFEIVLIVEGGGAAVFRSPGARRLGSACFRAARTCGGTFFTYAASSRRRRFR